MSRFSSEIVVTISGFYACLPDCIDAIHNGPEEINNDSTITSVLNVQYRTILQCSVMEHTHRKSGLAGECLAKAVVVVGGSKY